jgi:polyisoprenoid-binding protein YceI
MKQWTFVFAMMVACGEAEVVEAPVDEAPVAEAPDAAPPAEEPTEAVEEPASPALEGTVTVTTTKKETIQDEHTMSVSGGELSLGTAGDFDSLTGYIDVDLASWSSPIDIRDQRVRSMFFLVDEYPTARFDVAELTGVGALDVGATAQGTLRGTFAVSGATHEATMSLSVTRGEESWQVATAVPFSLSGADLGASDRIQAVAEACGVSLADEVSVQISLSVPTL